MYSSGIALPSPKGLCRTCPPSTAKGVSRQAASQGLAPQAAVAATLANVALHCATMLSRCHGQLAVEHFRDTLRTDVVSF